MDLRKKHGDINNFVFDDIWVWLKNFRCCQKYQLIGGYNNDDLFKHIIFGGGACKLGAYLSIMCVCVYIYIYTCITLKHVQKEVV